MKGGIYLIHEDNSLVKMVEKRYESEDLLQKLLATYPDLLAGDQMNEDAPRRWLLVDREVSVPDEEEGAGRWSLDNLFLDQDGIPTLIEVKRSSDTRIRREVVGQMLDYAANATLCWRVESLRAQFEGRCARESRVSVEVLREFLGEVEDEALYWTKVADNLKLGRIRMVFVADEIPRELRSIVEFLNQQMNPAEVLAVEIRKFEGQGQQTLVPQVYGQTFNTQQMKASSQKRSRPWTVEEFLGQVRATCPLDFNNSARLLKRAQEVGFTITGGSGASEAGLFLTLESKQGSIRPFYVCCNKRNTWMQFTFPCISKAVADSAFVHELRERVCACPDFNFGVEKQYITLFLQKLTDESVWSLVIEALEETARKLKES